MGNPNPSVIEMVNYIAKCLYKDGNYITGNINEIIDERNWIFDTKRDREKFDSYCLNTDWFDMWKDGRISLTKKGIFDYELWGSYNKYHEVSIKKMVSDLTTEIKKEQKDKWLFRIEFILKHTSTLVAILLSISTTVLTVLSISDKQERNSLEKEKVQLTKERDSIKQVLSSQHKQSNTLTIKDSLKP